MEKQNPEIEQLENQPKGFTADFKLKGDKVIWIVFILMSIVSFFSVASATSMLSYKFQNGSVIHYPLKHLVFLILGFICVWFASRKSYKWTYKISFLGLVVSLGLMIITYFAGEKTNGATRWLNLGFVSFQPSDLIKFFLICHVSKLMSVSMQEPDIKRKNTINSFAWMIGSALLVGPSNLSTAAMLIGFTYIILFVGQGDMEIIKKYTLIGVGLAVLFVGFLYLTGIGRLDTWIHRLYSFVTPDDAGNFQSIQSQVAIANGGFWPSGPGHSIQRNILPHPYSDFIYAICVEEGGLLLGISLIIGYLVLLYRCIIINKKITRSYPALVCVGLILFIVVQALLHIAINIGAFPTTGQTLPFISMGGSSMLISCISLGVIQNISRLSSIQQMPIDTSEQTSQEGENTLATSTITSKSNFENNISDQEKNDIKQIMEMDDFPFMTH